jgi:hypothetical protein
MIERAVYFLGNDRVLNFGIAAFESFRRTNPDLPAYLLPFNDELTKTRAVAARYNIKIIEDPALATLHAIAEEFWDEKHRDHAMFKKFFAFFGPAKTFLYCDCDVLILENLQPLFDKFEQAGLQFLSFDSCLDYVYNAGPFRDELLNSGVTRGFNAGVFLSRNGSATLEQIQVFFKTHQSVRSEFQDKRDQAMLNYFVDFHRWRHLNLAELDPTYCETNSGRSCPVKRGHDGIWRLNDRFSRHHGKRFCLLHWNGIKLPGILPNHRLYRRDRNRPEHLISGLKLDCQNLWTGRLSLLARMRDHAGIQLHRLLRRFRS